MAKNTNVNTKNNSHAWPKDSIPSRNRGEGDNVAKHERQIARLDRMHPPAKGGCAK